MRHLLLRSVMLVLIAAMLGGHITELFDHWDHTMRSGRDSDYLVVVIAASVGIGLVGLKRGVAATLSACLHERPSIHVVSPLQMLVAEASVAGPSPPRLLPIRI